MRVAVPVLLFFTILHSSEGAASLVTNIRSACSLSGFRQAPTGTASGNTDGVQAPRPLCAWSRCQHLKF